MAAKKRKSISTELAVRISIPLNRSIKYEYLEGEWNDETDESEDDDLILTISDAHQITLLIQSLDKARDVLQLIENNEL